MTDIILHDHMNPNDEIPVEADAIVSATPFGSGSSVSLSNGATIGVHETPMEVEKLKRDATNGD